MECLQSNLKVILIVFFGIRSQSIKSPAKNGLYAVLSGIAYLHRQKSHPEQNRSKPSRSLVGPLLQ